MACAALQLGRGTGLPCFISGETLALVGRPDLCAGGGMLEVSTVLCFEQLVIENERTRDTRIAAASQDTSSESLAVDVVRQVGPGGHFLAQRHTLESMKEFPVSRFAGPRGRITGKGGSRETSAHERARSEARRRIDTHRVAPLPAALEATLFAIANARAHAEVA